MINLKKTKSSSFNYNHSFSEILMFDNIDDVTTNPEEKTKLLAFFKSLLEMMQKRKTCMVCY